jgi:hypothetical protein
MALPKTLAELRPWTPTGRVLVEFTLSERAHQLIQRAMFATGGSSETSIVENLIRKYLGGISYADSN